MLANLVIIKMPTMRCFIAALSFVILLLPCDVAEWLRVPKGNRDNYNAKVGTNREVLEEIEGLTLTSCYLRCQIRQDCQSVALADHTIPDDNFARTNSMTLIGKPGLCVSLGIGGDPGSQDVKTQLSYFPEAITDINECELNEVDQCQQICVNTPGSFICQCEVGYVLDQDGRSCNVSEIARCYKNLFPLPTESICFLEKISAFLISGGNNCWYKCMKKTGLCTNVCGEGGFCCRRSYAGCSDLLKAVSPKTFHSCVRYKLSGVSYKYVSASQNWENAETECTKWHGHLASVTYQEENDYIRDLIIKSGGTTAWLGFNDKTTEGTWVWSDGSSTDFKQWRTKSGEPNGKRNENCAQLYTSDRTWNDLPCGHSRPYVCKKNEPLFSASYIKAVDGGKCPTKQRITASKNCMEAASRLGLTWGHTWHSQSDVPGCIFANDGRRKVYFNTALDAIGSNIRYAEICINNRVSTL